MALVLANLRFSKIHIVDSIYLPAISHSLLQFFASTGQELVELREQMKGVELQAEKQSGEVLELRSIVDWWTNIAMDD